MSPRRPLSFLPFAFAAALAVSTTVASATVPEPSAHAAVAGVPAKVPVWKTAVATLKSPTVHKLAAAGLAPVPSEAAHIFTAHVVGSHGAVKAINSLSDSELAAMPATELAALGAHAIHPNLLQRVTPGQRAKLSTAFLRVLDAAAADSPGKFDAVLANMRVTPGVIPSRFSVKGIGALEGLEQRVAAQRIGRGDLAAFDKRLGDMGMSKGDGSVKVLVDGKAAFADLHQTMMNALEAAKTTGKPGFVLVSTFALESDETGKLVGADLKELAAAGFKVHVLYDGFGSKKSGGTWTDPAFYADLRAGGVTLNMVKPGVLFMHNSHKKPIQIGYTTPEGPKLVEYNGDMNIGDEYREFWHGSMSRIEGPATKATLGALVDQLRANGDKITPQDEASFRAIADAQVSRPGMSPIWTVNHRGPVDLYNKMALLSTIDVAPKGGHIFLEQPYVDDPDLFAALEKAARDGVNVHLVVPKHNNAAGIALDLRTEWKSLLAAGVHVYQYDNPQFRSPEGFSHLKRVIVLDEKGHGLISEDGSSNGDAQSFYHNDELIHFLTTATISDPKLRAAKSAEISTIARNVFLKDIKSSTPVTASDLPKPGFHLSINDFVTKWRIEGWLE